MVVRKTDDKLKSLLGGGNFARNSIEEINVSEYISPIANIKVVGIGGAGSNAINRMIESGLE